MTRQQCKWYRIQDGKQRTLYRLLSPGYSGAQDFEPLLKECGATIISHGDAPEAFVGSWSGGQMQEYRYEIYGKRLYAYVVLFTSIDDYAHEWVISDTVLTAHAAADLLEQGRELTQATHFLYLVVEGQPFNHPDRLRDGWATPRNSEALRGCYHLCCDSDAEAETEAMSMTDFSSSLREPSDPGPYYKVLQRRGAVPTDFKLLGSVLL